MMFEKGIASLCPKYFNTKRVFNRASSVWKQLKELSLQDEKLAGVACASLARCAIWLPDEALPLITSRFQVQILQCPSKGSLRVSYQYCYDPCSSPHQIQSFHKIYSQCHWSWINWAFNDSWANKSDACGSCLNADGFRERECFKAACFSNRCSHIRDTDVVACGPQTTRRWGSNGLWHRSKGEETWTHALTSPLCSSDMYCFAFLLIILIWVCRPDKFTS